MASITQLHTMLKSRQISCQELTQQYLSAIEKDNGALHAYVHVTAETALETAKKVDEKIASGQEIAPLAGIPMTLKDNLSTRGLLTTCCSASWKGTARCMTLPCGRCCKSRTPSCWAKRTWTNLPWGLPAKRRVTAAAATPMTPVMWPVVRPAAAQRRWPGT